jgi:pimeloyl-ACP methyl ester carboxylesterase
LCAGRRDAILPGLLSRRQLRVARSLVAFGFAAALSPSAAASEAAPPASACGQFPGHRFTWVEPAFCDLPAVGAERAHGVVIWNHGISGTTESYLSPAPPAFRLLQARGWDVVIVKRHNLAETDAESSAARAVARTLEEVRARRAAGYRRVVLAGQSFGGHVALEAADGNSDVFAVVAMAPGLRHRAASGGLDAIATERQLARLRAGRVVLVLPGEDALFGSAVRGPGVEAALRAHRASYLLIDESSEVRGHAAGMTGRFALRYGACLADFLGPGTVAPGPFPCQPPAHEATLVRELVFAAGIPAVVRDPSQLPTAVQSLTGWWYGLIGDTIVVFALVDERGRRVAYRWVASRVGGGVYDATVRNGRVTVTMPKSSIAVGPAGEGAEITWTSREDGRVRTVPLVRAD